MQQALLGRLQTAIRPALAPGTTHRIEKIQVYPASQIRRLTLQTQAIYQQGQVKTLAVVTYKRCPGTDPLQHIAQHLSFTAKGTEQILA